VVRNGYAFNLRPARVRELVDGLPGCFASIQEDLLVFARFLDAAA